MNGAGRVPARQQGTPGSGAGDAGSPAGDPGSAADPGSGAGDAGSPAGDPGSAADPGSPAGDAGYWTEILRRNAAGYARIAVSNICREFPVLLRRLMTGPGDFPPRPRDVTPVFYGSFDWHSCVEMHWLLVRLLRAFPGAPWAAGVRELLRGQLTPAGLAAEARFARSDQANGERPYGWGWALKLAAEAGAWADPDARQWSAAIQPLGEALEQRFLDWLPRVTYPVRHGVHANTAFGLSLALPYATEAARAGRPDLRNAIIARAREWYGADSGYPAGYEPSGQDFLSPALAEAELMTRVLPRESFAGWLSQFLPGLAKGEPAALFAPVAVSDSSDGQIAHLHGLNASRAWCWRRIAGCLPAGDSRAAVARAAAVVHAEAALPHVASDDYMVSHWLVAYAVLLLSTPP